MIPHQLKSLGRHDHNTQRSRHDDHLTANVLVVADDIDIFILLHHFVVLGDIHGHVMMISPVTGWEFIGINAN